MDFDENDILATNEFIKAPILEGEVPKEYNEEFKKYYKDKNLEEENDPTNILATNKFEMSNGNNNNNSNVVRKKKEIKTYVSIDSRDRDKLIYAKPNYFKIFLGKTFYNVKSIRLASIEFPNTNAVINSTNNNIYWRNKEDIDDDIVDDKTQTYPVYNVQLRIGSYISTSLQNEITKKLQTIKRKNKVGDFHYFLVNLDVDTDIVSFTSLILTQLSNNPLKVTVNLGLVTVDAPSHGYETGDIIYILGAKNLAGITTSTLTGAHSIIRIDPDKFQYEVNVKAGETAIGGGNTVQIGKEAPFQLLFGENQHSVAQNLGYPLENSSERIDTFIKAIENVYFVQVRLQSPHNFTNTTTYVGQQCSLLNTEAQIGSTSIDGNRIIGKVIDANTILVQVNGRINFSTFQKGTLKFPTTSATELPIESISNSNETVLVTTFTEHNFELDDIGIPITFYNTISTPSFNGSNVLYSVFSPTQIILQGNVLLNGAYNVNNRGAGGSMSRHSVLETVYLTLTGVTPGLQTLFTCNNHGFVIKAGDKVQFYNLQTNPLLSGTYTIYDVPSNDSFRINFQTTSVDLENIQKGIATVGTQIIKLTYPYHQFNRIINITNSPVSGKIRIETQFVHNLQTNDKVRIMQTNSTPSLDDGDYEVTVIENDTFDIPYPPGLISPGTSGIIGMSHSFYLYGASGFGGISANAINNKLHTVREIYDEHNFAFTCEDFSTSQTKGGGNNLFISSLFHGFAGKQENTKNSLLNRSINLEGENYAFLCCPQLATMMNTGDVRNVFARITLDQSPGSMVFSFLSNPKTFDTAPLNQLSELEFSVSNWDNTLYEFNDMDYSFSLEITEIKDITDGFNLSSRRGVTE
jgi:hypothetical protein